MILKKRVIFFAILTIFVVDILLLISVFFISQLANPYLLLILVLLLATSITTLPILFFYFNFNKDLNKIDKFLLLASNGHLDHRINEEKNSSFLEIEKNLNIMMENLEKMSKSKNDFLSTMSHEIRTPMSAITGMVQIAQNSKDIDKISDCLIKIDENSKHLLGVINDILDFSKLESGKLIFDEQPFSLSEDLMFIKEMFQEKVKEKQLNFELIIKNIKNDGITTDSLRLNQVLINLLSNAIKFTNSGGSVTLSVEELVHMNGESVYSFYIIDTGIGLSPDQSVKLFSPFVQADSSTSRKYGGTGLGLVIAKNLVGKMGGDIELDSKLGEGSTFSFTIKVPAVPKLEKKENNEIESTPNFKGKRLLIVDDIEINRTIVLELLKETEITMETAENGQIALDMFLKSPLNYYDLILMDMQMPIMDGCEATQNIRASGRNDAKSIIIIAVTANVMKDDTKKVLDSGMNGHIGKPIDFNEMYKTMARLLPRK
ncbi:MAG: response regulator [Bacillales bacterium]|jgi:signal transduction histidine kinase/CheY-like chemotaxis protein|nr:response regulator [Bacillales bacterium]